MFDAVDFRSRSRPTDTRRVHRDVLSEVESGVEECVAELSASSHFYQEELARLEAREIFGKRTVEMLSRYLAEALK